MVPSVDCAVKSGASSPMRSGIDHLIVVDEWTFPDVARRPVHGSAAFDRGGPSSRTGYIRARDNHYRLLACPAEQFGVTFVATLGVLSDDRGWVRSNPWYLCG